jgi:zinc transport system ATP-binding protein
LLLDEPATGIDISSENDLNEILNKIRNEKNTTVIMVTHDWESAYHHSDKVIILNKKVICFDRPEQAFTDEYLRIAFGHEGHKHKMIFGTGAG